MKLTFLKLKMILRLSMVKLNCCVLSQCLQNIIIWYWARKFCLTKLLGSKFEGRKMNPCDIGTLTQKCLLAQKSVKSTPKRVIAPLCAPVTRNRKVCHFRCGFRFFFPWVWAGLFLLPDQNIKATILRGEKNVFS